MSNQLIVWGVGKWDLIKFLVTKIGYLSRSGLECSHILERNITFTKSLGNMSHNHYLKQPKPMIEMFLEKNIYKNPNLIKTVGMPLPVVRKYGHTIFDDIYYVFVEKYKHFE